MDDPHTRQDVWVLPLSGDRTPKPLLNTAFYEWEARVSPDGRWMAYVSDESGRWEVYVVRFPGGGDRLFERSYDVAPDGRFLLNVVVERKSLPLTVVTDWQAGLVK